MFTITSVNRESPLALAGIKPGDVPVGYKHGMDTGFYGDMAAVIDGQEVTFVGNGNGAEAPRLRSVARSFESEASPCGK